MDHGNDDGDAGANPPEPIAPPPRATILLATYASSRTVRAALEGALAQTVPCEILVSDDASPDDTYAVIDRLLTDYRGPHQVRWMRNAHNLGVTAHFNHLLSLASGDVVVFMAGDDISRPERVARVLAAFDADPHTMLVGCGYDEIDPQGRTLRQGLHALPTHFGMDELVRLGRPQVMLGAAIAIRRELFTRFGPLHGVVEDTLLTLRAVLLGRGQCLPETLLDYRIHDHNLTRWLMARDEAGHEARGLRQSRQARILTDAADDLEQASRQLASLDASRARKLRQLLALYRSEADILRAMQAESRWAAAGPLWRGLAIAGRRGRNFERLLKLPFARRR